MHPILKKIPRPPKARPSDATPRKYPFADLAVDEMFFVTDVPSERNFTTYAGTVGRRLGRKFSVRRVHMVKGRAGWRLAEPDDPKAVAGLGVWRVK